MVTSEKFWDKKAKGYAASPIKDMDAYMVTMEQTRAYLSADDRVLEVGCGTGSTALLLAENVTHITGSDISGNMMKIATEKAKAQNIENVVFVRATLDDDMLGAGAFDTVLAFNVLHLLEDLPNAVAQIHKRLKPGGRFISKTAVLSDGISIWRLVLPPMRLIGLAPAVSFFGHEKLDSIITQGGFEIEETYVQPGSIESRFIVAKKM